MVHVLIAAMMWVLVLLSITLVAAWCLDTLCSWPSIRMMLSNARRLAFGGRAPSVEVDSSRDPRSH